MEPIWLAHYPQGVPAQIDPARYASLPALFEESFKTFRDRKAFASFGETMTFGEVDHHSRDIAAWLQACNLPPCARVAIMMPNVLAYPAIIAAVFATVSVAPAFAAEAKKDEKKTEAKKDEKKGEAKKDEKKTDKK